MGVVVVRISLPNTHRLYINPIASRQVRVYGGWGASATSSGPRGCLWGCWAPRGHWQLFPGSANYILAMSFVALAQRGVRCGVNFKTQGLYKLAVCSGLVWNLAIVGWEIGFHDDTIVLVLPAGGRQVPRRASFPRMFPWICSLWQLAKCGFPQALLWA
jgi:hypothetical protein